VDGKTYCGNMAKATKKQKDWGIEIFYVSVDGKVKTSNRSRMYNYITNEL